MTFDTSSFLGFASDVVGASWRPSLQEAARRSAVSRAYYAVFLAARAVAVREGAGLTSDGADHLARLRKDRNDADYDAASSVADDAEESLEMARSALDSLNKL